MKKIPAIAVIICLLLAVPAFAEVCPATPPEEGQSAKKELPLEFRNDSGAEITSIFISQTGRDAWSEDLLKDIPLKNGEKRILHRQG